MKILHVLAQLPSRTGSGVYFSNMVEGFKDHGHIQKAIFAVQDDHSWDILPSEDQYSLEFKTDEIPFPIAGMSDVMPYDHTVYSQMTEEMLDQWKAAFRKKLIEARDEFQPDLVFAHHLWILTSMVVEIFPDAKIIGLCHNTDLRQAKMNPHIMEKHVDNLEGIDYVFTASEEQKEEINKIYKIDREKQIAVGGGFNQNIFYPPSEKEESDKIKLVFCAKIDPSKGVYELIEVYKSLELEDVTLDIIGSPDESNRARLEEYIGNDQSIRVYNVKDQVALGDELRKKDIFLMPSYYEGLGLMAIESLACGLHVVTTEIEALMTLLGEDVKESGIIKFTSLPRIYDTDKPVEEDLPAFKEGLRANILEQIEKVRAGREIEGSIKEEIQSHSWEGLVCKMNEIIKEI